MDLLVGIMGQRVDSASPFSVRRSESRNCALTKGNRRQTESVADEKSYLVGWPIRTDRSLALCLTGAAPARVSCTSSQCSKKMELHTSNAPPEARMGQWRACLRGEGEGASVPSVLPRQEPFQIVLRDRSEREEASGIRSRYMACARRDRRRATRRRREP